MNQARGLILADDGLNPVVEGELKGKKYPANAMFKRGRRIRWTGSRWTRHSRLHLSRWRKFMRGLVRILTVMLEWAWHLRNRSDPDPIGGCKALLRSRLEGIREIHQLRNVANSLAKLTIDTEGKLRQVLGEQVDDGLPHFPSYDDSETLQHVILRDHTPWSAVPVNESGIPGMLTAEECKYYAYIGRFFSGQGAVVEVGSWLGRSTYYIVQSLLTNPRFAGRKLYVFDDFIWRDFMVQFYSGVDKPKTGESFKYLFDRYMEPIRSYLGVQQRRLPVGPVNSEPPVPPTTNEHVPPLSWGGGRLKCASSIAVGGWNSTIVGIGCFHLISS